MLCKELASVRNPVSEVDLLNIIFTSLPHSYNHILPSILSAIKIHNQSILLDTLLDLITDEYDHLVIQDPGKMKKSADDVAFNADSLKKGKGKKQRYTGDCSNCSWTGHQDKDCWEEGSGKEGQAPKGWKLHRKKLKDSGQNGKGKSSAKANTTSEMNEPDSVWLASTEGKSDEELSIPLLSYATLVHDGSPSNEVTELYDSSALQHMLPACKQFINFEVIPPKPIWSADNHTFNAIRKGNLHVYLPNGEKKSHILLKDVLYAPSMKVTLVSISCLANAGYAALFCDQSCHISNQQKQLLSEVPLANGLYHTHNQYPLPFAGAA